MSARPTITIKSNRTGITAEIVSMYGAACYRYGYHSVGDEVSPCVEAAHQRNALRALLFNIGMSNEDAARLETWGETRTATGRNERMKGGVQP